MPEGFFISAGLATVTLIALWLGLTWIPALLIKSRQLATLRQLCHGKLAITYDDGPGVLMTPPLIDLLQRYRAKVTFFLVGFRAVRHPEMCDLVAKTGHQLGCHTHMHRKPWQVLPWSSAWDVADGYRAMARWLAPDAMFRPPFGKLTTWSWLAARWRGAALCWWTCDGRDTHPILPDPRVVVDEIQSAGGGVVLLHSHDRGADRQEYVLKVTELLLQAAREKNLKLCTMSELLESQQSTTTFLEDRVDQHRI